MNSQSSSRLADTSVDSNQIPRPWVGIQPPTADVATQSSREHTSNAEINSFMTVSEVIARLSIRGCANVTDQLDETSCSKYPISNGGYGDIYRAKLRSGTQVAIKTMRLLVDPNDQDHKHLKHAARELYTWSKCRHRNVQRLLGLVEFRGQIGMVSVWENNGDLSNYIQRNSETDRYQLSTQVAEGLSYLHEVGIVHGDLKASNVLVSEAGIPLLADFGNATLQEYTLKFTSTSTKTSLSSRWAAPELLEGKAAYSAPADVYALGMTILETMTGTLPWSGRTEQAVMFAVVIKKASPERPLGHIPDNSARGNRLWPLLRRCWAYEPGDRPSATEIRDVMQEMAQKRVTQTRHNATSEGSASSLPNVNDSSHHSPSGQPGHVPSGGSGNPATTNTYPASSLNQPPRSARQGFRPIRGPNDLQPRVNPVPVGRRPADGIYLSALRSLTTHIIQTYNLCNPAFDYESALNPRRLLTQPGEGVYNDGYDNADCDYILYVGDRLGPDNKYLILDDLGQGGSSWVAKCRDMKSHEIVAVKVIKNKPAYFNQGMMEVTILELLNTTLDPNDEHHIVRLRDSFIHKNHICLVFELLSINLIEVSKQALPDGFRPHLVSTFTSQLLDAMTVLNEARLIHGDLNLENILLINLKSPQIKLIDFGSACHERQAVDASIQALAYRSPEVLFGLPYNSAIDMWSLGCIVVEFILNRRLFSGTSEYEQVTQIVETVGMPPPFMLRGNTRAREFFSCYQDQYGREQYYLRRITNYPREYQVNNQSGGNQLVRIPLPDMVKAVAQASKSGWWAEDDTAFNSPASFIDFVSGLLNLNPMERWSPQQAKGHPFITRKRFEGPYIPSGSNARNTFTTTMNAPVVNRRG